jgi:hypothetical protein
MATTQQQNNTYLNSPREFKRGQADGISGAIIALTNVIKGTDKGDKRLADKELEKIRRVFLMWRDYIIEAKDKNPKALDILIETKKIMDIPVSK